ncbi:MAG: DUF6452 family protein [Bacteroidia bacterium]|jgi:Family of unknown function (DUF6452)
MKIFWYLIFILLVVSACKEVYDPPHQAFAGTYFLNANTQKAFSSNITVWGDGRKDLWLKDTTVQKVMLPLSSNDTTKLMISFDSYVDTITFIHETYQKYESMETGFYFEYKLKSIDYTHHRIADIQIADSLVTINWHENIILYLRPLPAGGI